LFVLGWALKEFQKSQKQPIKRISPKVKSLPGVMFHTGTINPNQKMTAGNIHEELWSVWDVVNLKEKFQRFNHC